MSPIKSIINKKASQNMAGDVLFHQMKKLINDAFGANLKKSQILTTTEVGDKEITALDDVSKAHDMLRGHDLLETIVQNLSFRVASELFEISKDDSKNGLDRLFESIQQKYNDPKKSDKENADKAKDIFLKVVTHFNPTYVITPHPTETLTTDAITLERRLSESMHSKKFVDWVAGGFKKNDPIVKELTKNLKSLLKELQDNVPNANLDIRKEITRGLKNTERFHDATEIFLNMVDRTLFKHTAQRITVKDIDKYFSKGVHGVLGWQGTDQDGKKEARPWFILENLFPPSKIAVKQLYMLQIAKIQDNFEKSHNREDVSDALAQNMRKDTKLMISKLMNELDTDKEKVAKFFELPMEERIRKANSKKKEDKKDTPNIAKYIYDKLYKANKNKRFGINDEIISLLEETAEERAAAIKNNTQFDHTPYRSVWDLNRDLTKFDDHYGKSLPHHQMLNGVDCEYNSVVSLKTQIYNTGDEALKTQLRQNSADVEGSLVYALKDISKTIELPQSARDLIGLHDQKVNSYFARIQELKDENAIYDLQALRHSSDPIKKAEIIDQKLKNLEIIDSIEGVDLKRVREKIDTASAQLLEDMAGNKQLTDAFKQFISSRDEKYHNDLKPTDLARKLVLIDHPDLKPNDQYSKELEKEKESQLAKLAAVVQKDIEAYDRLKSVKILVDNPERMPHYITAECDGSNTVFAQHILTKALIQHDKRVENLIFSLPESVDSIRRAPDDWKTLLNNPYILDQIKRASNEVPFQLDEKGNEKPLKASDVFRRMGIKDIAPELENLEINSKHIVMFPSSDINKVFSGPAANFLIADVKYKLMQEFAKKGIYLEFEEGVGSNVLRGNPKMYNIGTVQGRGIRISQEAICSRDIAWKVLQGREHLDLPEVHEKAEGNTLIAAPLRDNIKNDPRFNYLNNDLETYRYISNNPEKWDQYSKMFNKVGESYAELYESKPFSKYFAVGSFQEFAKLISFSARSSVKTGDAQKDFDIYPTETSVDKIRAIQFAASTAALNPHGGITIHSIFENGNGDFDLKKFNTILEDYSKGGAERNPVLQESINKAAISLAQSDLTCSWKVLGFKRTRDAAGGYIEIGEHKLRMEEIKKGKHDQLITDHLIEAGLYQNIKADHQEDFKRKIFDEVVAIRTLAQMDIDTVKSRKYISMMMKAVDQGKTNITGVDVQKEGSFESQDTKQVILDCLPHLLKEEMTLSNDKANAAFERLAEIHIELKKGTLKLPAKKGGEIHEDDPNFPLYKELCYLVAQIMENRERVPAAMLQTDHAREIEYLRQSQQIKFG